MIKKIVIKGKAGDGVQFVGLMLSRTLTERGFGSLNYGQAQATPRLPSVPANYTIEGKTAKVVDLPLPSDIPFEYAGQLVTEYYWKIKP